MTTALLARIERLPVEWRHPLLYSTPQPELGTYWHSKDGTGSITEAIALDLHLRHIAEKLADSFILVRRHGSEFFFADEHGQISSDNFPTYAEALVAAAEAVGGREGT